MFRFSSRVGKALHEFWMKEKMDSVSSVFSCWPLSLAMVTSVVSVYTMRGGIAPSIPYFGDPLIHVMKCLLTCKLYNGKANQQSQ